MTHGAPKTSTVVGNRSPVAAGMLMTRMLAVPEGAGSIAAVMPAVFSDAGRRRAGQWRDVVYAVGGVGVRVAQHGDGDAAVGRHGDGPGGGDRRSRLAHDCGADVRGESAIGSASSARSYAPGQRPHATPGTDGRAIPVRRPHEKEDIRPIQPRPLHGHRD